MFFQNMTQSIIQEKSFQFAVKIVDLYRLLQNDKEFIISKQIIRSGTSIGANVEEALQGQSKADFIAKLSVSLKEAVETRYWLKLLIATKMTNINLDIYLNDINEIVNTLTKIIKTTKLNK